MTYFDEIKTSIEWFFKQSKRALLVGQTANCPGTFMYQTSKGVPEHKRLEFPVNESFQMQFTLGLAMGKYIPVSMFPRQNFLLLGLADMVNMMDKLPDISKGRCKPHLIIRTATGPYYPVHPGHQHVGNYTGVLAAALNNFTIIYLDHPKKIRPAYEQAANNKGMYLFVEEGNYYNEDFIKKYGYNKKGIH